MDSSVAV